MSEIITGEESPLLAHENVDVDKYLPPSQTMNRSKFWVIMISLYLLSFLSAVDATMVVTLMGTIASELNSQEHISWIGTSYLLSSAAFQPIFGKLSDVFGRRLILVACIVCFSFGCLICGLSKSLNILVLGRFISGIGGGGLSTLTSICISDMVSARERGIYGSYSGLAWDLGTISGGILSGFCDKIWGWQSAFLIQIPVCFLAACSISLWLDIPIRNSKDRDATILSKLSGIDWVGCGLLVTSLLSLMILTGTSQKDLPSWSFWWFICVTYMIFGFIAFYMWEDKCEEAVIPLHLLHNKAVLISAFTNLFTFMNILSDSFYVPYYWSTVENFTPLESGYLMIPSAIGCTVFSIISGHIVHKTGKYRFVWMITAFFGVIGGFVTFSLKKDDGYIANMLKTFLMRTAIASSITYMIVTMITSTSSSEMAMVTSIMYGFRSIGSTLGVSLSNALMQLYLVKNLNVKFEELKTQIDKIPNWTIEKLMQAKEKALDDPKFAFKSTTPSIVSDAIVFSYDYACHIVFAFIILTVFGNMICIYLTKENDLDTER